MSILTYMSGAFTGLHYGGMLLVWAANIRLGQKWLGSRCSSVVKYSNIGNCDIDFVNFRNFQSWTFEILNLFDQNQNFAVNFWKYWKQNQKSTKYTATEWKNSIINIKFSGISFFLWNLVNFCKISQFLITFSKSPKDFRKILLKWLGKTVKYWHQFH